jgi:hydroxypyruvate reductase
VVVTVRGHGRGGPNTEFALAFASACEDLDDVWLLSADTDGADGAAKAAGALVPPGFIRTARAAGFDPEKALMENDSASCFADAGLLVNPGPTFTNVNDFRAIVVMCACARTSAVVVFNTDLLRNAYAASRLRRSAGP